jgi:carboxyl-terminal processing protease
MRGPRRPSRFIPALIVLATLGASHDTRAEQSARVAPAAPPSAEAASVDHGALFDKVVNRIFQRYFDPDHLTRAQWIDKANAARAGVAAAPSLAEAVARINRLIDELGASHLRLHTPDDFTYYVLLDLSPGAPGARELIARRFWGNRPHYDGIGAFTALVDGRHFVDGVLQGSPAERTGLKVGDEIVAVDGAPYHMIASFRGKSGRTAELTIRRAAEGPEVRLAVPVTPIVAGLAFEMATIESARVIERGGKRIGYVQVWALMDTRPLQQAFARLDPGGRTRSADQTHADRSVVAKAPLDALIVDMRGKVGGTDQSRLLIDLIEGQRGAPYTYRGRQSGREPPAPRNPSLRGRTALLIDHHTRSAGELVSNSFRQERLGTIFGTTTAGHVLASQIEVMPGDLVLQIAVSRPEADGLILEGKGVAPDVRIERPLPYSNDRDPVLEAALQHLTR